VPSPKLLVFLDSNVLFSALYSTKGSTVSILNLFIAGKFKAVISQQVLEEVARNMKAKLPQTLPAFQDFLLDNPPIIVKNPSLEEVNEWSEVINFEDAGILASAVAVQPDYFVTGDKHFFESTKIAERSGLRIVTPSQLLQVLKDSKIA
jgi:uncharacterized protein